MADFIAYYRVSTSRQAQSGLGLEAQKQAVLDFINGNGNKLIAEFTEVESGKRCDRPELNNSLNLCRETGAKLVIARLDRLARNAAFLLTLRDRVPRARAYNWDPIRGSHEGQRSLDRANRSNT